MKSICENPVSARICASSEAVWNCPCVKISIHHVEAGRCGRSVAIVIDEDLVKDESGPSFRGPQSSSRKFQAFFARPVGEHELSTGARPLSDLDRPTCSRAVFSRAPEGGDSRYFAAAASQAVGKSKTIAMLRQICMLGPLERFADAVRVHCPVEGGSLLRRPIYFRGTRSLGRAGSYRLFDYLRRTKRLERKNEVEERFFVWHGSSSPAGLVCERRHPDSRWALIRSHCH